MLIIQIPLHAPLQLEKKEIVMCKKVVQGNSQ